GAEHALQAVKLNDKVGFYHLLVAANSMGDQELDRAREYCERVLKMGKAGAGADAYKEAGSIYAQLLPKTYTLHWKLDPRKGRAAGGTLAVALPKDGLPYQSTTYEVSGARSSRLVKGTVNDVLHLVPQRGQEITLTTKVTVRPHS